MSSNSSSSILVIGIVSFATLGVVTGHALRERQQENRPTPTVTVTAPAVTAPLDTPSPVATGEPITVVGPTTVTLDAVLTKVLPYYGKPVPDWCAEDMTCWLGSSADGRSPEQVWASLEDDVAASVKAYGSTTWDPPREVKRDWVCESDGDDDCGSWATDVKDADGEWHYQCVEWAQPQNMLGVACPDGYVATN